MEKPEKEGNERVWKGQAEYIHTHLAARARKAQLVKVLRGHREEGAEQSWEWPVEAFAAFSWAAPGQRVQSRPTRLQAMGSQPSFSVSGAAPWSQPLSLPMQPPTRVKSHASGHHSEGSRFEQANFLLLIGTLIGIWLLQSQFLWHYQIFVWWCTRSMNINYIFFLLSHDASLQDKNPTHRSLSFNPLFIRPLSHTNSQEAFPWCTITPIAHRGVSQTLCKFMALLHYIIHLGSGVVKYVTTICLEIFVWKTELKKKKRIHRLTVSIFSDVEKQSAECEKVIRQWSFYFSLPRKRTSKTSH